MSVYKAIDREKKRAKLESQNVQNTRSHNMIQVDGIGRFSIEEPLRFGAAYLEKPSLTLVPEEYLWQDNAYPSVTAGVRSWITDEKGYYVGAYVWVAVT